MRTVIPPLIRNQEEVQEVHPSEEPEVRPLVALVEHPSSEEPEARPLVALEAFQVALEERPSLEVQVVRPLVGREAFQVALEAFQEEQVGHSFRVAWGVFLRRSFSLSPLKRSRAVLNQTR